MRLFGRKRAAAMAVVFAALAAAPVANAAVMRQQPSPSYQANGTVRKIIVVGNTAYLGGDFTAMIPSGGGTAVTRNHAAAVDMTTGNLLPWNPNVNGTVRALLASGGNVYLGGSFTTVGGVAHRNMVEVNGTTGAPVAAFANTTRPNKMVRAFVQIGNNLYVGGAFTSPRSFLMEVNATNNTYIPTWQPVVDQEVHALATDTTGSRIIEGGFQQCPVGSGCDGRIAVGAVTPTDGSFLPFAYHGPSTFIPPPGFPYRPFQSLSFTTDGDTLFLSGSGNGGTLLSINMEDGNVNWRAGFNGNVVGAGVTDGVVYIGGHYSDYCGPINGNNFVCAGLPGSAARDKLTAVDEATGAIFPWNPSVNTVLGIEAVAAGNNRLAIGGEFTRVAGVDQQHFARFTE